MADIAGLPFWQLTFDAQGDLDEASARAVLDGIAGAGITDLVVFSHGWNNSQASADRLYRAWFRTMAGQRDRLQTDPRVTLGAVGVFWPSQMWSDEPIPDFEPAPLGVPVLDGGPVLGAAAAAASAAATHTATMDDATLDGLRSTFPDGADQLTRIADLLGRTPSTAGLEALKDELTDFLKATTVPHAVPDSAAPGDSAEVPGMVEDSPEAVFGRYAAQLKLAGMRLEGEGDGGAAGLGDRLKGLWHGAKEAARQATYWQMKNRAGVVGQRGLGPFLGRLQEADDGLRVHLVGHSFGARLVSFALLGLPEPARGSTVASVTLLQGAFSHFAFAPRLPFDASRSGALDGMTARIDGPLTVCFSSHDDAVGTFYPLASMTAREDAAGAQDRFYRWGGMGHDGAQATGALLDAVRPAGPGTGYRFRHGQALNIDCSDVVARGGAPSGAHSDIVHPELTWIVLAAGGLVAG